MMKVIFTSNRLVDFLIRLSITAIVISPVIIWSWDTVKETTADVRCLPLLSLSFTPVCSCLFCIFVFLP
ncbi:conjugal transfer protein TrbE [Escherichia coli]